MNNCYNNDLDRLKTEYALRSARFNSSDRYSLWNRANLFIYQHRQRELLKLLSQYKVNLIGRKILEVGCGGGGVLLEFLSFGAKPECLYGIDLIKERIIAAHKRLPNLQLVHANGQQLPYHEESFDLVLQFTVFSSILDEEIRYQLANEMIRVLKPSGLIVWYDFWINPTNPQTLGIRPNEIKKMFPHCDINTRKITLAPPLSRRLVPISWGLASLVESLKLFNTHYLALIRPKKSSV